MVRINSFQRGRRQFRNTERHIKNQLLPALKYTIRLQTDGKISIVTAGL